LGAIRGIAQTVSYEVSLMFFFLAIICLINSFNLSENFNNQEYVWFIAFIYPIFIIWLISSLAESNRSPFDFADGESELVSEFNVEYGGGGFALLFLSEYASIIFISIMFMGGLKNVILFNILRMFFWIIFIWIRGTHTRLRYDKLMMLEWKSLLPFSLGYFLYFYCLGL